MTETERRLEARRSLWAQSLAAIDLAGKSVLDAGTGEGHCTSFLADQGAAEVISITCLADEIPPVKAKLGERGRFVDFRVADLTRLPEIPSGRFDVVVGDFLLAAVAAYTPYREIECLSELARVLKVGGRLVLTGWEIEATPRSELDVAMRRLFSLRSAVHHLVGVEPFREHPRNWIERRLSEMELPTERTVTVPDVHHDFRWFGLQIRRSLEGVEPHLLREALTDKLDELEQEVVDHPGFARGVEFGGLYAVVSCKLHGALLL